jgi:hypothetical protein
MVDTVTNLITNTPELNHGLRDWEYRQFKGKNPDMSTELNWVDAKYSDGLSSYIDGDFHFVYLYDPMPRILYAVVSARVQDLWFVFPRPVVLASPFTGVRQLLYEHTSMDSQRDYKKDFYDILHEFTDLDLQLDNISEES